MQVFKHCCFMFSVEIKLFFACDCNTLKVQNLEYCTLYMCISNYFDLPVHRACKSGSGLRVLNCLCCTVLQVDTIVINVVKGDCATRLFFLCVFLFLQILMHASGQGNPSPAAVQLNSSSLGALLQCNALWQFHLCILILCQIPLFNSV